MHMDILNRLSEEMKLPRERLEAAVWLLDEGNTVPFVARYRKEATGGMDDAVLRNLTERLTALRNLEKRKEEIKALIAGQGLLTPELADAIDRAGTVTEADDLYRPYRPKRRTRASVARERGLGPLADLLAEQRTRYGATLAELAQAYVDEEKGVPDAEAALAGARDILAETYSDDAELRGIVRRLTVSRGSLRTKKAGENPVFEQYYDYAESLSRMPGHRILAVNRGEKEGALSVSVEAPRDRILDELARAVVKKRTSPAAEQILMALEDGYDRLTAPSVEREIRAEMTDRAGEAAIGLFSVNLRNLLMQAPVKGKCVMGFDPGYRTGCKLAVVTRTGAVAETAVIYPTKPREDTEGAKRTMKRLINRYGVDVIAIGNGTASGESELFVAELLRELDGHTKYIIVSEAGASVYSASELGAEEFPDFDVTERSAVSIARRLQDPLSELVKIDPKSIGVGQYQHDLPQSELTASLKGVVEDCVNAVGVDLNTASPSLLRRVSGLTAATAKNIVTYREENGAFTSRAQLKKVPKLGPKAYQQCAGFLRVPESRNVLDNTAVHPESYDAAKALLALTGHTLADVKAGGLAGLPREVELYGAGKAAAELGVGEPTLRDVVQELTKPGRDIRESLPQPILRTDVMEMKDLREGMKLTGTVRNVIDFGAFVDIGVHQDGLVHISEIADRYLEHPSQVLSVGDVVQVVVLGVDEKKKRISLSIRQAKD